MPLPVSEEARAMLDAKREEAEAGADFVVDQIDSPQDIADRLVITTCKLCGRHDRICAKDTLACAPAFAEKCVDITLTRVADRRHRERSTDGRLTLANLKRERRQSRNRILADRGALAS